MDIFTLTVIQSLANGIQVAALYGQYRMDKTHSGPNWWTAGCAAVALGFVFNSLRGIPAIGTVAIVANNILFFTGLSLLYIGVLRFFGKREQLGWLLGCGALFTLLIVWFTFINNDLIVRRVLISGSVATLSFLTARALYLHKLRSVTASAHFLAAVFMINSLFFVIRALTPFAGATASGALAATLTLTVTYLVIFIISTLWTFGFIIMVNQRLNAESREVKEHFELLFNTSPDPILIIKDGIFVDCNKATEVMLRGDRTRILGQPPEMLSPELQPDGSKSSEAAEKKISSALKSGTSIFEWTHRRLTGENFDVEVSIASMILEDKPALFTTWRDITVRKQVEKELEESRLKLEAMSITDGLTGIANRRRFDDLLLQEHARHVRSGADLSLILLDIDHFKAFNDNYGHVKGDDCLRQIGRVLADCTTRAADLAARYGGEEFACILPETELHGAIVIAEQIRRGIQALAIPHNWSSAAEYVTASFGVVTVKCCIDESVEDILNQVDVLLYQAKSSGRNRIEFVAPGNIGSTPSEEIRGSFVQLVWKDSFCCGNKLIDAQHQSLFHISNKLFDAILSERPASEVSALIAMLLAEVTQHFNDEQFILETIGFPGLGHHIEEHTKLLTRGVELSEQFKAATLSVGDVFQFLAYDVVMIHMLGADREYFQYIASTHPATDQIGTAC